MATINEVIASFRVCRSYGHSFQITEAYYTKRKMSGKKWRVAEKQIHFDCSVCKAHKVSVLVPDPVNKRLNVIRQSITYPEGYLLSGGRLGQAQARYFAELYDHPEFSFD